VDIDIPEQRYAPAIEAGAYFVIAEALTNVIKHAAAQTAGVVVQQRGDELHVCVIDDGRGGVDPARGSGLRGLADRLAALDGTFTVKTTADGGTRVRAVLPLS
jgi:signal transduction histidine kinase